jgi:hypothetical protein
MAEQLKDYISTGLGPLKSHWATGPAPPPDRSSHVVTADDESEADAIGVDISLTLSDEDLERLAKILGTSVPLETIADIEKAAAALRTVSVAGHPVELEKGLITRLRSRCIGNQDFGKWLEAEIKKQLHGLVGW